MPRGERGDAADEDDAIETADDAEDRIVERGGGNVIRLVTVVHSVKNRQQSLSSKPAYEAEAADFRPADLPVRRQCHSSNRMPLHRHLRNRLDQVDCKGAAERELPIGSGQIESSHRPVVQARLKRPGAWWSGDNIDGMLSLRLCRANDQWDENIGHATGGKLFDELIRFPHHFQPHPSTIPLADDQMMRCADESDDALR